MFLDKTDLCVIESLCENSRTHMKAIAEKAGVSIQTVSARMKRLEKEIGLRYAIEFDLDAVGMSSEHLVRIRLKECEERAAAVSCAIACPNVQLACETKGDFDLFLWVLAPSMRDFSSGAEPRIRDALGDIAEDWTANPLVSRNAGFIPLGREAVELFSVRNSRKPTLSMLNEDARISVKDLAERLGVTEPTAEYHLKMARPFVKRFTAFFVGRGEFSHVIRFIQLRGGRNGFRESARKISDAYLNCDPRLFNRLVYSAKPSGGMDAFMIETYSPLEDKESRSGTAIGESAAVGKHVSAEVTRVLKGALPIRKVNLAGECSSLVGFRKGE
jgi:DNA-binding Lrp family transcriptional regulator